MLGAELKKHGRKGPGISYRIEFKDIVKLTRPELLFYLLIIN